jgi:hypothetical protein
MFASSFLSTGEQLELFFTTIRASLIQETAILFGNWLAGLNKKDVK